MICLILHTRRLSTSQSHTSKLKRTSITEIRVKKWHYIIIIPWRSKQIDLKRWLLNSITKRAYPVKTNISNCLIFRHLFKPKININSTLLTLGAYYVTFNSSRSLSSHSKPFSIAIVPYRKGFDHFLPDTCFIPLFYIANFQLIVTNVIVVLRIFQNTFFKYLLFYTNLFAL